MILTEYQILWVILFLEIRELHSFLRLYLHPCVIISEGWFIDFNKISTRLRLFHALKLWNHIDCTFIFAFLIQLLRKSFSTHSYWIRIILKYLTHKRTITSTPTPSQSGPGSMTMKRNFTLSWVLQLDVNHHTGETTYLGRRDLTYFVDTDS